MFSEERFMVMLSEAKEKEEERLLMNLRRYIDERFAEILEEINQQRIEILLKDANHIFKR